jgi:hypothetical protein
MTVAPHAKRQASSTDIAKLPQLLMSQCEPCEYRKDNKCSLSPSLGLYRASGTQNCGRLFRLCDFA